MLELTLRVFSNLKGSMILTVFSIFKKLMIAACGSFSSKLTMIGVRAL